MFKMAAATLRTSPGIGIDPFSTTSVDANVVTDDGTRYWRAWIDTKADAAVWIEENKKLEAFRQAPPLDES